MKDERWYWPIRLLKVPGPPAHCQRYLAGASVIQWTTREPFAENTKLCAAILIGPQGTEDGSEVCTLPGGEEVNFYQVIPLYRGRVGL